MPKTEVSKTETPLLPPCLCDVCRQSLCDWLRAYERQQESAALASKGRNPFLARALWHHAATHLRHIRRVLTKGDPSHGGQSQGGEAS